MDESPIISRTTTSTRDEFPSLRTEYVEELQDHKGSENDANIQKNKDRNKARSPVKSTFTYQVDAAGRLSQPEARSIEPHVDETPVLHNSATRIEHGSTTTAHHSFLTLDQHYSKVNTSKVYDTQDVSYYPRLSVYSARSDPEHTKSNQRALNYDKKQHEMSHRPSRAATGGFGNQSSLAGFSSAVTGTPNGRSISSDASLTKSSPRISTSTNTICSISALRTISRDSTCGNDHKRSEYMAILGSRHLGDGEPRQGSIHTSSDQSNGNSAYETWLNEAWLGEGSLSVTPEPVNFLPYNEDEEAVPPGTRGRQIENLTELKAAISAIPQHRESSSSSKSSPDDLTLSLGDREFLERFLQRSHKGETAQQNRHRRILHNRARTENSRDPVQ